MDPLSQLEVVEVVDSSESSHPGLHVEPRLAGHWLSPEVVQVVTGTNTDSYATDVGPVAFCKAVVIAWLDHDAFCLVLASVAEDDDGSFQLVITPYLRESSFGPILFLRVRELWFSSIYCRVAPPDLAHPFLALVMNLLPRQQPIVSSSAN